MGQLVSWRIGELVSCSSVNRRLCHPAPSAWTARHPAVNEHGTGAQPGAERAMTSGGQGGQHIPGVLVGDLDSVVSSKAADSLPCRRLVVVQPQVAEKRRRAAHDPRFDEPGLSHERKDALLGVVVEVRAGMQRAGDRTV